MGQKRLVRPDTDMHCEIREMAETVLRQRHAELSECAQRGDAQTLRLHLHTLQGEALECGLPMLAEACARVRQQLPRGNWQDELTRLLAQLWIAFERLRALNACSETR